MTAIANSKPGFAIVGAPKTGTTALFSWMRHHPDVYMPEAKELHFFDEHRGKGVDWYLEQFGPAGNRLAGEATTTYLGHPTAIEELVGLNPEIRLVAVVRDPVDRAWSHYHYGVSRSWFHEPFEVMVLRELGALLDGEEQPNGLVHESRYGLHLERASRHVPADRLLVLRQEELDSNPENAFARLCRFLGVDEAFRPPNLGSRAGETHRARHPRVHRALLRSGLDRRLPERARLGLGRWLAVRGYPDLDPQLRVALAGVFETDQAKLRRFTDD